VGDLDTTLLSESQRCSDIVYVACRGDHLGQFDLKARIELSKFDARQKRVLLLVKKQERFCLCVIKAIDLDISWRLMLQWMQCSERSYVLFCCVVRAVLSTRQQQGLFA
jgi:hypothetical protein